MFLYLCRYSFIRLHLYAFQLKDCVYAGTLSVITCFQLLFFCELALDEGKSSIFLALLGFLPWKMLFDILFFLLNIYSETMHVF